MQVGRGAFGSVFLCTSGGQHVAVKRMATGNFTASQWAEIRKEVALLRRMKHLNVLDFLGTVMEPRHFSIVTEFCRSGSLASVLREQGVFPEPLCASLIADCLRGLAYIHSLGIVHRDIKGANILLTDEGIVKLADFGAALILTPSNFATFMSNEGQNLHTTGAVGTPYWMAPEYIITLKPDPASDVWSIGCTIVELVHGRPPFFDLMPVQACYHMANGNVPIPETLSAELQRFLRLIFKSVSYRASIEALLCQPWITNANEANKTLAYVTLSVQQFNKNHQN
jgi:serine/threonine protein kinase